MSKIEETLKKIAAATSKENSPTSSSTNPGAQFQRNPDLPGDPNCPVCGGVGYIHKDLPINHPDFGKLEICICRTKQISRTVLERLYTYSNLDQLSHLTFETFKVHGQVGLGPSQAASLERAYNHARQFASSLGGWLLLSGGYGCGKTHLAAAIANEAVSLGVPTLFLTAPDLLDWLRMSFDDDTSFADRFEEIRNIKLLVLDDFGTQNTTPWAQEKLFQIMNYRYINHLPMVITTNLSLEEIDGRLRSRLQDPELVTAVRILATDYRRPTDDTGHPELSSLGLHANQTFGNFNLRQGEGIGQEELRGLEKAYQSAKAFAERPQGWIVITGGSGCGKTHLAAAIGNYQAGLGYPPLFVVVSDLLDHLRATFNPNSMVGFDRRFYEVRTAPLLILDDLGAQSSTPWVREKLYQLLDHRYSAQLPTVITTVDTIENMDTRIQTRILDTRLCKIYAIVVPPYRAGDGKVENGRKKPRKRGGY
jgi:DNA replication protein DnaC